MARCHLSGLLALWEPKGGIWRPEFTFRKSAGRKLGRHFLAEWKLDQNSCQEGSWLEHQRIPASSHCDFYTFLPRLSYHTYSILSWIPLNGMLDGLCLWFCPVFHVSMITRDVAWAPWMFQLYVMFQLHWICVPIVNQVLYFVWEIEGSVTSPCPWVVGP